MARTFKLPPGTEYPATLADWKLSQQNRPHKRLSGGPPRAVAAPYPEVIPGWLGIGAVEVGAEEVNEHGD